MKEPMSEQTHNVIDLASAKAANILVQAAMNVNCPTVYIEQ
jgi:hypothetical protein